METGEDVAGQIEALLHEVHQRLPSTRIVVMAILPKVPPFCHSCPLDGSGKREQTHQQLPHPV